MKALVTCDADEGRYVALGCIACRADVRASYGIATPVRMYVAALCCDECGGQLVEFDAMTWRIA